MSLSEIRVNTTKTRTGVGTITYTETGPVITGIATASNFKTGSTNVHSTGVELANINTGGSTATFGGPISGTTASFSGTVSIGGTLTYEDVTNIDSVGVITARNGIYLDKFIYHSGDLNTSFGFPNDATDTFVVNTNSTEKFRITSLGKVGIGTNDPKQPVSITGRVSIDAKNDYYGVWADGDTAGENHISVGRWYNTGGGLKSGYSQYGINNLILENNHPTAAHTLIIQPKGQKVAIGTHISDGLVHIGQTSAGSVSADAGGDELVLESSGNTGMSILSPSTGESTIFFGNPGTNGQKDGYIRYYHESHSTTANRRSLVFITGGGDSERLRIRSDGKLQIGTAGGNATYLALAGNAAMDLWGDGSEYPTLRLGTENYNTVGEDIRFGRKDQGSADIRYHSIFSRHGDSAANNYLEFRIHDFGSSPYTSQKTVLNINGLGNMGLGTNSPNHYNNYSTITLNGASGGEIDFEDDGTLIGDVFANAGGLYLNTRSAVRPIKFQTHNGSSTGERMQLTGTGQLNIGGAYTQTTFQAQITGDLLLQKAAAAYDNPLLELYASNNTAHGGSIKFTGHYNSKYELARIRAFGGNGSPGSNGGALAFSTGDGTEKLKIQADGNIMFGVNEPTIRVDSGNGNNGSCLKVEIDGTEEFRFDPGSFEFKNSSNASRGTLLGGINYYSNTNLYVDLTQWRLSDNWNVLEVFGYVNPNSSGSGQYTDPLHMYIYRGVGWANGGIKNFIYSVHVAPPARQAFPGGSGMSGNSGVSAVWCNSGSIVGNESATSTHYVRLVIPNANANANFQKTFRILRRF